ncbi:MAG: amidohydrolase family protein [Candidatus Aminicenantales bacterium]
MKTHPLKFGVTVVALAVLLAGATGAAPQETLHKVWAIKGCRIVVRPGSVVAEGTVLVRDGLIEAAGAGVAVPKDAEVIDGSTLTVYPGLFDGLGKSLLKLPEKKYDPSKVYTGQYTDADRGITPELKACDHFQISKGQLEKHHKFGITTAHVMPERGIFTGQASVFSLCGTDRNEDLLLKNTCLGIGFSYASFMVYPSSLMGVVALIRQELADAARFDLHRRRWESGMNGIPRPVHQPPAEVLADFATGKRPVVFLCQSQHDIRRALRLAEEFDLDFFIADLGNEAFRVVSELKKARARMLLPVTFKAPSTSVYAQKGRQEREQAEKELYVRNPAALEKAGVRFAFVSLGVDDPQDFIEGVRKAIEAGLSREAALAALTEVPAAYFGLERALGTVEPGKIANLVLAEGDIFDPEAKVRTVFADGKRFEIEEARVKEGEKPAVNISGKWEITIAEAGLKITADFVQEGAALSGKITTPFGIFDFSGGTVSGNEVYFEMSISAGGQEIDLYFSAVVEDDRMTGTVVQGTQGSAEFTAKRIPG